MSAVTDQNGMLEVGGNTGDFDDDDDGGGLVSTLLFVHITNQVFIFYFFGISLNFFLENYMNLH